METPVTMTPPGGTEASASIKHWPTGELFAIPGSSATPAEVSCQDAIQLMNLGWTPKTLQAVPPGGSQASATVKDFLQHGGEDITVQASSASPATVNELVAVQLESLGWTVS